MPRIALRRTIAWHRTQTPANATGQKSDYAAEDAALQRFRQAGSGSI